MKKSRQKFFRASCCLLVSILLPLCLSAQILSVKQLTKKARQYEKTEFNIRLRAAWKNPYVENDIALDMLLRTPTGKELLLPCYYEKGNSGDVSLWKARFAATIAGKYHYRLRLKRDGKLLQMSALNTMVIYKGRSKGFLRSADNWHFQFDNGEPFRGLGENIGWESRANDDSKFFKDLHENPKYNYEQMLPALKQHGGNFFRTWISHFNLPLDWQKDFNNHRYEPSKAYYNPSAIKKIDRLFDLSDSLGVYVMLTLGPGNYRSADGGFASNNSEFFTNENARTRYKDRLRYLVARWGFHTSIGAWEFFNEVDNFQFANKDQPVSAVLITAWHREMSDYLAALDPYRHLITTSISHRDVEGLNDLSVIDFNQKHIYKHTDSIPSAILHYEKKHSKPYVIGEYSYEWDWSKNFNDFANEMDEDFKKGLWLGLFSPTPILPLSWWWEYFDSRGTDAYLSNVDRINKLMLASGRGKFNSVQIGTPEEGTKAFGVVCGNKLFVYLRNENQQAKDIVLNLPEKYKGADCKFFDCHDGRFINVAQREAEDFKKLKKVVVRPGHDIVVIIN